MTRFRGDHHGFTYPPTAAQFVRRAETTIHLFGRCELASSFWNFLNRAFGWTPILLNDISSLIDIITLMGYPSRKEKMTLWDCFVRAFFWNIWLEHNARIFTDKNCYFDQFWITPLFWLSIGASFHYHLVNITCLPSLTNGGVSCNFTFSFLPPLLAWVFIFYDRIFVSFHIINEWLLFPIRKKHILPFPFYGLLTLLLFWFL